MSDLQVQAELTLKDNMTKPAAKGLEEVAKSADKLQQSGRRGADGRFLKQMATDGADAARSMDAVGREAHELQQHIKGAERSGSALRRTLNGVRDAGRDASKYMSQMGKGLAAAGRNTQAAGGGVMAAGYVAKTALEKPVDREKALLDAANVAYADRDATGRRAGVQELDQSIRKATAYGGGSYNAALDTQGALFAANLDKQTVDKLLPQITRTATAYNARGTDLAQTAAAGIKLKQFTPEETEQFFGMMAKTGAAGSFEMKDMGQYMPGIFANAPSMKGMQGAGQHLANLQVMRDASGSSAEAATLYENLQAFRTSPEAAKNLKKKGVNLPELMDKAAQKGEDLNLTFASAIQNGVVEKDKKYKQLKAQWQKADGEEKLSLERRMKARQEILYGKIIGDRQARQAAIALENNKERRADVYTQLLDKPKEEVNKAYDAASSSTAEKMQSAINTKDNAAYDTFLKSKDTLDSGIGKTTDFFANNPQLATLAYGGATAGGMATAAGATWGGIKLLQGGKTAATAGTVATGAKNAGTAIKFMSKAAAPLAVAGTAYDIVSTENNETLTRAQKNVQHSGAAGGLVGSLAGAKGGAMAGAAFGAMIGSFAPVIGNAIGVAVGGFLGGVGGGILGYWGGSEGGRAVGEMAFSPESAPQQTTAVTVNANVTIDGQQVAGIVKQTIEYEQSRDAARR